MPQVAACIVLIGVGPEQTGQLLAAVGRPGAENQVRQERLGRPRRQQDGSVVSAQPELPQQPYFEHRLSAQPRQYATQFASGAREHAQQTLMDTLSAARHERMAARSDTPGNLVRSEEFAMTMATPDAPSAHSSAKPAARFVFTGPRHLRLDLIGASALVVAVAGLGATVVLLRTLPAEPNAAAVVSASPVRDQWYLEWTGASDRRSGRTARLGSEGSLVPGPGQREYRARWRRTRP